MKDTFFKFPSTPHLALIGNVDVRGDKVMSEAERDDFLKHEIVVEEKVDGANLGISFDSDGNPLAQNRGAYLQPPYSGQWKKLGEWLAPTTDILFEKLSDRYILFGEWCYARHTIYYDQLPDWFFAFDVYDKHTDKFWSYKRRNELLQKIAIHQVPEISHGVFTFAELKDFLINSKMSSRPPEGLYLRINSDLWLEKRAKLVQPGFIQSIQEHWLRSGLKANRLRHGASRGMARPSLLESE